MIKIAQKHIDALHDLSAKRVIKQISRKMNLTYLGSVQAAEDYEHQLVRGITAGMPHVDSCYTIGAHDGYDVTLLQRRVVMAFPGKQPVHMRWFVLQIDLTTNGFAHTFIDTQQQNELFYATLFSGLPGISDMSDSMSGFSLKQPYKIFSYPHFYERLHTMLSQQTINHLITQYGQFDYEITDDRLLVYLVASIPAMSQFVQMLNAGIWFARVLDKK